MSRQTADQQRGIQKNHGLFYWSSSAAPAPGSAQFPQLAIYLRLTALRGKGEMLRKKTKCTLPLLLAQPPQTGVVFDDRLPNHCAFWFGKTFGSIGKFGQRLFIQRERDLYHTGTILPYRTKFLESNRGMK